MYNWNPYFEVTEEANPDVNKMKKWCRKVNWATLKSSHAVLQAQWYHFLSTKIQWAWQIIIAPSKYIWQHEKVKFIQSSMVTQKLLMGCRHWQNRESIFVPVCIDKRAKYCPMLQEDLWAVKFNLFTESSQTFCVEWDWKSSSPIFRCQEPSGWNRRKELWMAKLGDKTFNSTLTMISQSIIVCKRCATMIKVASDRSCVRNAVWMAASVL